MISDKEVKHIAKLARLELSQDEVEKMRRELSSILGYFDSFKKLNVEKIKPTSHSVYIENIMREDIVKKQPNKTVDKLLKAMPEKKERYLKVKSVL